MALNTIKPDQTNPTNMCKKKRKRHMIEPKPKERHHPNKERKLRKMKKNCVFCRNIYVLRHGRMSNIRMVSL
jgi:hypothetical protein